MTTGRQASPRRYFFVRKDPKGVLPGKTVCFCLVVVASKREKKTNAENGFKKIRAFDSRYICFLFTRKRRRRRRRRRRPRSVKQAPLSTLLLLRRLRRRRERARESDDFAKRSKASGVSKYSHFFLLLPNWLRSDW